MTANGDERTPIRVTDKRSQDAPAREAPPEQASPPADGHDVPGDVGGAEPAPPGGPADALEAAQAEAAQHLDDLRRLKAEFENFRKRMVREQTAMIERASAAVVERMLPILDNFELALIAADRTQDYASMVRGVELVYSELLELLHKEGLERIESLHATFDPELHEAVMRAEDEGEGDLIVVDEMRPGYRIHGRVVRPAMVKVGHRKA